MSAHPAETAQNRDKVGVIGAGRWGTVLAHVVSAGGRPVVLFARDRQLATDIHTSRANPAHLPELDALNDNVTVTSELTDVTRDCHLVIVALPVVEMREVMRALGETLDGSQIVLHAVRGLEPKTFATPSQIIREETLTRKLGALLGPALVEELLAARPNAAVVASVFPEVVRAAREALVSPSLRVYSNTDVVGVEAAAAASNIMALAVGIALELSLGPATLSVLMTRGVAEIARLCKAVGGKEATASGLAGLGDLLVLRESGGREVQAGRRLARGEPVEAVLNTSAPLDVLTAVQTFRELAETQHVEAEITSAIYDVIYAGLGPLEAVQRLMTLGQMAE